MVDGGIFFKNGSRSYSREIVILPTSIVCCLESFESLGKGLKLDLKLFDEERGETGNSLPSIVFEEYWHSPFVLLPNQKPFPLRALVILLFRSLI